MNRLLFLVLAMILSGAGLAHPDPHFHTHPFAGGGVFAAILAAIWAAMLGGRVLSALFRKKNGR